MKVSILKKERELLDRIARGTGVITHKDLEAVNNLRDKIDRVELVLAAKKAQNAGIGYLAFRSCIESVIGPDRVRVIDAPWYPAKVAAKVREYKWTADGAVAFAESLGPGNYNLYGLACGLNIPVVDVVYSKREKPPENFQELPDYNPEE